MENWKQGFAVLFLPFKSKNGSNAENYLKTKKHQANTNQNGF